MSWSTDDAVSQRPPLIGDAGRLFALTATGQVLDRMSARAEWFAARCDDAGFRKAMFRFFLAAQRIHVDTYDGSYSPARLEKLSHDVFAAAALCANTAAGQLAISAALKFYEKAREELLAMAGKPLDFDGMLTITQALARLADGLDVLALAFQ